MESPTPSDPGCFELKRELDIHFVPTGKGKSEQGEDGEGEEAQKVVVMQTQAACLLAETAAWNEDFTKVIWQVKWTAAGLMPVRPVVLSTLDFEIPKGHALQLI